MRTPSGRRRDVETGGSTECISRPRPSAETALLLWVFFCGYVFGRYRAGLGAHGDHWGGAGRCLSLSLSVCVCGSLTKGRDQSDSYLLGLLKPRLKSSMQIGQTDAAAIADVAGRGPGCGNPQDTPEKRLVPRILAAVRFLSVLLLRLFPAQKLPRTPTRVTQVVHGYAQTRGGCVDPPHNVSRAAPPRNNNIPLFQTTVFSGIQIYSLFQTTVLSGIQIYWQRHQDLFLWSGRVIAPWGVTFPSVGIGRTHSRPPNPSNSTPTRLMARAVLCAGHKNVASFQKTDCFQLLNFVDLKNGWCR